VKYFVSILFLIWEVPQNILGALLLLFVYAFHRPKIEVHNLRLLIQCNLGISLGSFVFWVKYPDNIVSKLSDANKFHEYGHSIQSKIFGPIYLIIIGVPSVIRAIYACLFYCLKRESWNNYYLGFPENWADRLGGVDSNAPATANRIEVKG
jgi:hypothetical protein